MKPTKREMEIAEKIPQQYWNNANHIAQALADYRGELASPFRKEAKKYSCEGCHTATEVSMMQGEIDRFINIAKSIENYGSA